MDRLLRFLTSFASHAFEEDQLEFVEDRLETLASLGRVGDHGARWRALQLLSALLMGMPADAGLSEDVVESLLDVLLDRAKEDAKPAARAVAVRALARLSDPGEAGDFSTCPVTALLVDLVRTDSSRDVRKASLASLPPCAFALGLLLDHTLDPDDEVVALDIYLLILAVQCVAEVFVVFEFLLVSFLRTRLTQIRKVVFLTLADKIPAEALAPWQRRLLLQRGLRDRAETVAQAASTLVEAWSLLVESDPVDLVAMLEDQEDNPASHRDLAGGKDQIHEGDVAGLSGRSGARSHDQVWCEAQIFMVSRRDSDAGELALHSLFQKGTLEAEKLLISWSQSSTSFAGLCGQHKEGAAATVGCPQALVWCVEELMVEEPASGPVGVLFMVLSHPSSRLVISPSQESDMRARSSHSMVFGAAGRHLLGRQCQHPSGGCWQELGGTGSILTWKLVRSCNVP